MRLTRIYVAEALAGRKQINLPEQASGHVSRVLRLGQGDALRVFDGTGGEYDAVIRSVGKRSTTLDIKQFHDLDCESPLAVTLLQGIARGERMDLIVQKATELGVQAIQPLLSLRSNVKLDADAALRKVEHWQAVAAGACEQSGRNRLPTILPPCSVAEACAASTAGLRLTLAIDGAEPLPALLRSAGSALGAGIAVLIGPEGGLDDSEQAVAAQHGFRSTLLGPRVLRTETAPLAVLSALQALAGDFDWAPSLP